MTGVEAAPLSGGFQRQVNTPDAGFTLGNQKVLQLDPRADMMGHDRRGLVSATLFWITRLRKILLNFYDDSESNAMTSYDKSHWFEKGVVLFSGADVRYECFVWGPSSVSGVSCMQREGGEVTALRRPSCGKESFTRMSVSFDRLSLHE